MHATVSFDRVSPLHAPGARGCDSTAIFPAAYSGPTVDATKCIALPGLRHAIPSSPARGQFPSCFRYPAMRALLLQFENTRAEDERLCPTIT